MSIDIDKHLIALAAAVAKDDEKAALPLLIALGASLLKDIRRAADALEAMAKADVRLTL